MRNKNIFLVNFIPPYYISYLRKIDELYYTQKLVDSKDNLLKETYSLSKATAMSFEKAANYIIDKYIEEYYKGE